jgi:anthranilate synthase/aminodeoxychorismate synthase-like glutamine amidotransferase
MFLIIDNYDSFTFNLYQLIAQVIQNVRVIRNDRITINEINQMQPSAVILSPGPGRPENAGICVPLIRKFYNHIPILGVCLGHQAIAYAFGAKIIHAEQVIHGKETLVFHSRKNVYKGLPLPFKAGRYHSLIIDKNTMPDELIVDAESVDGEIMGIKHKEFPVYGLQFHPESILTPDGASLIKNFIDEVKRC